MQRQQRSLLSFFSNSPLSKEDHQKTLGDSDLSNEKLSYAQMVQRQDNVPKNFDMLKKKFLRPQRAPTSEDPCQFDSRQELFQEGDKDSPSPPAARREQSLQDKLCLASENAANGRTGSSMLNGEPSLCLPQALGCRPSIPGIKRVREDHDVPLKDPSDPLKRKKLMEALGDDEGLEQGAWAEAKAKFEWLNPSNIRDAKGRKQGDPYFDKRTLQIPAEVLNKMSASQKQYWTTKCQYMDTVLFFKVGKFYELYELDAEVGHKELHWKMTMSGVGKCRQVGVPESGIEDAVQKLIALGYKVGRMEQIETAEQAKAKRGPHAMVQRKLTHVLTPSTAMDENVKAEAVHLLALREEPEDISNGHDIDGNAEKMTVFGFAFVDAAAGRFYVGSLRDDSCRSALGALLTQVAPQELLYEMGGLSHETTKALRRYSCQGFSPLELTPLQPNVEFMDAFAAIRLIQSHGYFRDNLDNGSQGFGALVKTWSEALNAVNDVNPAATALGALVLHLRRIKLDDELLKNGFIAPYEVYKGSLRLDGQTLSNLEIFKNNADGGKAGTLISYLDSCSTPFGKRLLRRWMCHPLQSIGEINDRLDAVEEFLGHPDLVGLLRTGFRRLPDLERLLARIRGLTGSSDTATIPVVWSRSQRRKVKVFCAAVKGLLCGFDLMKSLHKGDREEPLHARLLQAVSILEGMNEAYELLVEIETHMDKKFSSLKSRVLKQEQDLKDEDTELLNSLLMLFNQHNGCWLLLIENLSRIDVLMAFSVIINGANGPSCRPQFVSNPLGGINSVSEKGGAVFNVKGLWHPFATGGQCGVFVPNDVELGWKLDSRRTMLLTGPNMGGKSTLLRATCLAVILAQLGCYVPAQSCILSPVDIIFTRLGASDRIMSGESTFMVECMEASSVLRYATRDSLVVLDELGRGTSTFDGYAIAYAVFRYLVDTLDCRLLFATHYHPLTKEFAAHPAVSLQHMSCAFQPICGSKAVDREHLYSIHGQRSADSECTQQEDLSLCEKQLVFLYKLASGASPDSYGLQVALLAGIPRTIVKVAEQAASMIRSRLSSTFKSISHREQFSYVHEQWLRTILATPNLRSFDCNSDSLEMEDAYDTLLCIWHELQISAKKASES